MQGPSGYSTSSGSKGTPGGELTNGGNGNGNKWVHPVERNVVAGIIAHAMAMVNLPRNALLLYPGISIDVVSGEKSVSRCSRKMWVTSHEDANPLCLFLCLLWFAKMLRLSRRYTASQSR